MKKPVKPEKGADYSQGYSYVQLDGLPLGNKYTSIDALLDSIKDSIQKELDGIGKNAYDITYSLEHNYYQDYDKDEICIDFKVKSSEATIRRQNARFKKQLKEYEEQLVKYKEWLAEEELKTLKRLKKKYE